MNKADLLDEDKTIPGQKWACVSFVSPENICKKKELFYFEKFLKTYDYEKNNSKYSKFLQFISYKHEMKMEDLLTDYNGFLKTEKENILEANLYDEYKNFMDKYEEKLQEKFDQDNNFETNTRGIKIRGSFENEQLANDHAKKMREYDPNHNVYVGPVGIWIPWDPDAYKTGNVVYMEEDLQNLMSEKNKNEQQAKDHFQTRIQESKENAIKENIEKAKKSGNKLTQNIENGNLVGTNNEFENEVELVKGNIEL